MRSGKHNWLLVAYIAIQVEILDRRTFRILLTSLLFAIALVFIYAARKTLVAFVFAIFFAYLLDPVVTYLQRFVKTRGRSITVVYLAMLVLVMAFFAVAGPKIVDEGRKLISSLPQLSEKIGSGELAQSVGAKRGWSYERRMQIQQFLAAHRGSIVEYGAGIAARAAQIVTDAWWLVLIPLLALFFLKDGKNFADSIVRLVERGKKRELLRRILRDLNIMFGAYIRAQLILAMLSGAVYTALLAVMRVPYATALGPAAGVCEFVPVAGPFVAIGAILLVAFLSNYNHTLALLACLLLWRSLQDYVNSPHVMGARLELHPLAAIFGVLAGGEIGGIVGVFLSIPLMAALRIVWQTFRSLPYVQGQTIPEESGRRFAG